METYRLKNIVILILLLLNGCLLLLVFSRGYARLQAEQDLISHTTALLQSNEIQVDPSLLEGAFSPLVYSYERDTDAERSFAEALLGPITTQSENGGGLYFYASENGSASFRSNGSFTLERTAPEVDAEQLRAYVRDCCPAQYRIARVQSDDDTVTVTAAPYVDDFPVYNASISFTLEGDATLSVSGVFLPAAGTASEAVETISKSSATIYLMDHCNEEGRVCNTITGISTGYLLQSTVSSPLLLTPVYKVDTNTYSYYVHSVTGHVSLAE